MGLEMRAVLPDGQEENRQLPGKRNARSATADARLEAVAQVFRSESGPHLLKVAAEFTRWARVITRQPR
jgi:hypothetical protein